MTARKLTVVAPGYRESMFSVLTPEGDVLAKPADKNTWIVKTGSGVVVRGIRFRRPTYLNLSRQTAQHQISAGAVSLVWRRELR